MDRKIMAPRNVDKDIIVICPTTSHLPRPSLSTPQNEAEILVFGCEGKLAFITARLNSI